jgi:hypothetical protein
MWAEMMSTKPLENGTGRLCYWLSGKQVGIFSGLLVLAGKMGGKNVMTPLPLLDLDENQRREVSSS